MLNVDWTAGYWQAVAAIAESVSAIVVIVAAAIAAQQVWEARRLRQLQVLFEYMTLHYHEGNTAIRRRLFSGEFGDFADLGVNDRMQLERLIWQVDQLGRVIALRGVNKRQVFTFFGWTIIQTWVHARAYIEKRREQPSYEAYALFLQDCAKQAVQDVYNWHVPKERRKAMKITGLEAIFPNEADDSSKAEAAADSVNQTTKGETGGAGDRQAPSRAHDPSPGPPGDQSGRPGTDGTSPETGLS